MHLGHWVHLLHEGEVNLADACEQVGETHADEPDVRVDCLKFAKQCRAHAQKLEPFLETYPDERSDAGGELRNLFEGPREGPIGMLRDLHDLFLAATECDVSWTLVAQAASGLRDHDLLGVVAACEGETEIQATWFKSRMKHAAPQTLVVARP